MIQRQTLINDCLRPFVSAIYRIFFLFFYLRIIIQDVWRLKYWKFSPALLRSQLDFSAYGLLPKKHRTHYSRPKRCSQKVLQTRLLYTFPLKMYQYFKYSDSLLFTFDRCRRVVSGLLISEVQAFLQKPSLIIIILIFVNRKLRPGLLIFRLKKSKISRDYQGQIRGKIGRFRGIFAGKKSKFAEQSADFAGEKSFAEKSADWAGF